jgi:hypothetical protein
MIHNFTQARTQADSRVLVTTPVVLHRPYIVELYILPLKQASKTNRNENSVGDISKTFQYKHRGDLSITQIIVSGLVALKSLL